MLLAAGKIASDINTDGIITENILFQATAPTKIIYMQFASEHSATVHLNLFAVLKTAQVRLIKKDAEIKVSDLVLQVVVEYDLQDIEQIIATADVNDVISYIITGELIIGEETEMIQMISNTDTSSTVADAGTLTAATSNYTTLSTDDVIDCTSGTFDITLISAVGRAGKIQHIKNSGSGLITIKTASAQTIDGIASGSLVLDQYTSLSVVSDGSNWIIIGNRPA